MSKAEVIKNLKKLTSTSNMLEKDYWQTPRFSAGVAKGSLVELLGNARTEWLLEFFLLHPEPYIFWCEREAGILPTAIQQRGVALHRIKFIHCADDLQQPLRLALESGQYPFIVAPTAFDEIRTFQRLQLLAEKTKSTLFLLAKDQFSSAWPISLQMDIHFSESGMKVNVIKQKQGLHE